MFLAASLVTGVCSVGAQMLVPLAAHFSSEKRQGQTIGLVMSGLLTGIMLARPLAGFVCGIAGWRALFLLSAGVGALVALTLAVLLPRHRSRPVRPVRPDAARGLTHAGRGRRLRAHGIGGFVMVANVVRGVRVALVGTALALLLGASSAPKVGADAPPFELTLIDGSKVSLDQLRGNVVVLNFWATWCVPCRKELPLLDRYYAVQKPAGLRVFTITTEDSVPLYQLKKLFAAMAIPSAKKIKGPYAPIGDAVPTSFVIDRTGRVRYAKSGAFELDALNTLIVPLLKEPAPTPAS